MLAMLGITFFLFLKFVMLLTQSVSYISIYSDNFKRKSKMRLINSMINTPAAFNILGMYTFMIMLTPCVLKVF